MNTAKRFDRDNIDKIIYDPTEPKFLRILKEYIAVAILDFFPIYVFFIWSDLFIIFKFSTPVFLIIFSILVIFSLVWIYIVFFKYYKIKVNQYNFKISNLQNNFKFALVTDIHIGRKYYGTNKSRLQKIINKINTLNLDLVILDGDFICDDIEEDLLIELKQIKAKYKLAVYGNHDCDYLEKKRLTQDPKEVIDIIQECGFKVLINEGQSININSAEVFFGGIPDLYTRRFNINKAFVKAPKSVPKVLLSHNPDIIDFVEDSDDIDLILSGHNHSGMIYIKPFGALLPMPSKYKWLTKGVFKIGKKTRLFLSQGAGYSGTRLRIGTESEIALITLEPKISL